MASQPPLPDWMAGAIPVQTEQEELPPWMAGAIPVGPAPAAPPIELTQPTQPTEEEDSGWLVSIGDWLADSLATGEGISADMLERARSGAYAEDASLDEGFWDFIGSKLERGGAAVDQGFYNLIAQATGSRRAREYAQTLEGGTTTQQIAGAVEWDDLKEDFGLRNLGNYMIGGIAESVPGTVAAAIPYVGVPALFSSIAGNTAEERARNDGRDYATGWDLLAAVPSSAASALLERIGVKGAMGASGLRDIGVSAVREAGTEFGQGVLENAGGTAFTERGFDPMEALDQGIAGAVVGAGFGAGVGAGASSIRGAAERTGLTSDQPPPAAPETFDRATLGDPVDSFVINVGREDGSREQTTVEAWVTEDGDVVGSIGGDAPVRMDVDSLRTFALDPEKDGYAAFPTPAAFAPENLTSRMQQAVQDAQQRAREESSDPTKFKPADTAETDLMASQAGRALADYLQSGRVDEAQRLVTTEEQNLRAAKAEMPEARPAGWEKIKVRSDPNIRKTIGEARSAVSSAKNINQVRTKLASLAQKGLIPKDSVKQVNDAYDVGKKAQNGSGIGAARQLATTIVDNAKNIHGSQARKFTNLPRPVLVAEMRSVLTDYMAQYGKWKAQQSGQQGARVNLRPPESKVGTVQQMFDRMNESEQQQTIRQIAAGGIPESLRERPMSEVAAFARENREAIESAQQDMLSRATPAMQRVIARQENKAAQDEAFRQEQARIDAQAQEEAAAQQEAQRQREGVAPIEQEIPGYDKVLNREARDRANANERRAAEDRQQYEAAKRRLQPEAEVLPGLPGSPGSQAQANIPDWMADAVPAAQAQPDYTPEQRAADEAFVQQYEARQAPPAVSPQTAAVSTQAATPASRRKAMGPFNAPGVSPDISNPQASTAASSPEGVIEQNVSKADQQSFVDLLVEMEQAGREQTARWYANATAANAGGGGRDGGRGGGRGTAQGDPDGPSGDGSPVAPVTSEFPSFRRLMAKIGFLRAAAETASEKADWAIYLFNNAHRGGEAVDRLMRLRAELGDIPGGSDLSKLFARVSATAGNQWWRFQRTEIEPLNQFLKDKNIPREVAGLYLLAKATPARNAKLRKRGAQGKGTPEAMTWLSDTDAANEMQKLIAQYGKADLEAFASKIYAINKKLMDQRVDAGVMTREDADAMMASEPFYVPMRGWAVDGDMNFGKVDSETRHHRNSSGDTRRREFMQARGRESMPENPIDNVIGDAASTIMVMEQYRATRDLVQEIRKNPEAFKGVATVQPTSTSGPSVPDQLGQFSATPVDQDPYARRVKVKGVEWRIDFDRGHYGKLLMKAVDSLGGKDVGRFWRMWSNVMSVIKRKMTTQSPIYVPVAWLRDSQDAILTAEEAQKRRNSPAYGLDGYAKEVARQTRYTPTAFRNTRAVFQYLANPDINSVPSEFHEDWKMIDEMVALGGTMGQGMLENATEIQRVNSEAAAKLKRLAQDPKIQASLKAGKLPYEVWRAIISNVETASHGLDMQVRYGTYKAAIAKGLSPEQAARLARDSSLDLSRRGALAPYMDNLFFFFSPTVESMRKSGRLVKSKAGMWALTKRAVMFGGLATLWNLMMAPDSDDDGESDFKDIDQDIRKTRFIFWYDSSDPDGYLVVPTGFLIGYPQYVAGVMAENFTDILAGGEEVTPAQVTAEVVDGLGDAAAGMLGAYSPIRGSDEIMPSALKPLFYDLMVNENFFDSPIYNEQTGDAMPDYRSSREGTEEGWKYFAEFMNDMTGGDMYESGILDFQPEVYRYIAQAYGGGVYRTAADAVTLAHDLWAGVDNPDKTFMQQTPILNRFVGSGSEYAQTSKYYERTGGSLFTPSLERAQEVAEYTVSPTWDDRDADAAWERFAQDNPQQADPDVRDAFMRTINEFRRLADERKLRRERETGRAERADIDRQYRLEMADAARQFNMVWRREADEREMAR